MKSRHRRIVLIVAILAIAGAAAILLRFGRATAELPAAAAPAPAAPEADGYGVERSFGSPRRASFL